MHKKRKQRDRAHGGRAARKADSNRANSSPRRWPLFLGGAVVVLALGATAYVMRTPSFEPVKPADPSKATARLRAAIDEFIARVEANPGRADTHGDLGLLYAENGFHHEAVDCFRIAEQLDDKRLVWPFRRAMSMREIGETAPAAALLTALADRPGAFAAINYELGVACAEAGDLDRAVAQFNRAAERMPAAPEPLVALADVYNRMSRFEKARDLSQKAMKLDPNYLAARYQLGLALRGVGDRDGAKRELQLGQGAERRSIGDPLSNRAADLGISRAGLITRAIAEFQRGNVGVAEGILRKLVDEYPDDVAVLNNYAAILIESKRHEPALEILHRVVRFDDKTFGPHINLSHCCLQLGRVVDAVVHARNAVKRGSHVSQCHVALGDALSTAKDADAAMLAYERALELAPDNTRLILVMGGLCRQAGRLDEALRYFQMAVGQAPDSFAAQANLCTVALDTGAVELAVKAFARAEAIDPNHPRTSALRQRLQVAQRP